MRALRIDALGAFERRPAAVTREFAPAGVAPAVPIGSTAVLAPISGTVVSLEVRVGDAVRRGQALAVLEVMKMEQVVEAEISGYVRAIAALPGAVIEEGALLLCIEAADLAAAAAEQGADPDARAIRPKLPK